MAEPKVDPELAWVRDRDISRRWAKYWISLNDNVGASLDNHIVWTFGPLEDLYFRGKRSAWLEPVELNDDYYSAMHRVMFRVWWQVFNRVAARLEGRS